MPRLIWLQCSFWGVWSGLWTEIGRDLDETITCKAMSLVIKFAQSGDLESLRQSFELALLGVEYAKEGPREIKCFDRMLYGKRPPSGCQEISSRLVKARKETRESRRRKQDHVVLKGGLMWLCRYRRGAWCRDLRRIHAASQGEQYPRHCQRNFGR